jgi:pyridoxine/pyridoxamine 5'-phosphate oxidase
VEWLQPKEHVMTKDDVLEFLRSKRLGVIATADPSGAPEAALVGFAVATDGRLIFDTSANSRKAANLAGRPEVAMVVGWDDDITVQIEGVARRASGGDLATAKAAYFAVWPDGRARETWPDIAYIVVTPHWLRYSDFSTGAQSVDFRL